MPKRPMRITPSERESSKGYDIIFIGVEHPIDATKNQFDDRLQRLAETFEGPLAIVLVMARAPLPSLARR